jgi:hypothetical protein
MQHHYFFDRIWCIIKPKKYFSMKTLKFFIAAAFTFISIFSFANNDPDVRQKIRAEVAKIIAQSEWKVDQDVTVTFYVNSKNEIIVNSTNNDEVDHNIKSLLNYKKIDITNPKTNELYILPVKVRK